MPAQYTQQCRFFVKAGSIFCLILNKLSNELPNIDCLPNWQNFAKAGNTEVYTQTSDKFLFLKKPFFFKKFLQTLILEKEQKSNSSLIIRHGRFYYFWASRRRRRSQQHKLRLWRLKTKPRKEFKRDHVCPVARVIKQILPTAVGLHIRQTVIKNVIYL